MDKVLKNLLDDTTTVIDAMRGMLENVRDRGLVNEEVANGLIGYAKGVSRRATKMKEKETIR